MPNNHGPTQEGLASISFAIAIAALVWSATIYYSAGTSLNVSFNVFLNGEDWKARDIMVAVGVFCFLFYKLCIVSYVSVFAFRFKERFCFDNYLTYVLLFLTTQAIFIVIIPIFPTSWWTSPVCDYFVISLCLVSISKNTEEQRLSPTAIVAAKRIATNFILKSIIYGGIMLFPVAVSQMFRGHFPDHWQMFVAGAYSLLSILFAPFSGVAIYLRSYYSFGVILQRIDKGDVEFFQSLMR